MEESFELDQTTENQNKRPQFLKVLCILSFIFIGISLIGGLIGLFGGKTSEEEMINQKVEMVKAADEMKSVGMDGMAEMFEKIQRMSESINDNFYLVSSVSIVVMGLGLFGVLKMWNGFRLGFHLYIGYSLLSIIQIYFFVSPTDIPTFVVVWNLLFSGLFVFLYSRNLKWMTK